VTYVLIPYSGWSEEMTRNPTAQPSQIHWNAELRNSTGNTYVLCASQYTVLILIDANLCGTSTKKFVLLANMFVCC